MLFIRQVFAKSPASSNRKLAAKKGSSITHILTIAEQSTCIG